MQQNERKSIENPEVPEERVRVVECRDGPAMITSKELAPILSSESGTLQNACSTRPGVAADLEKSARLHKQNDDQRKYSGHVEEDWSARKQMATCCQP